MKLMANGLMLIQRRVYRILFGVRRCGSRTLSEMFMTDAENSAEGSGGPEFEFCFCLGDLGGQPVLSICACVSSSAKWRMLILNLCLRIK